MIKQILDEISNEGSTNQKMVILAKYKSNELLKRVLYLACSKRIKFYIKQIPLYTKQQLTYSLETAIKQLEKLSDRTYTGGDASNHLSSILGSLSEEDSYVIERIIEKDLKIGMGGNINKIFPKLIEETPYFGAKPFDSEKAKELFKGGKWCFCDVKMDGRYNNAIIRDGEVELESRQGEKVILDNAKFLVELKKLPNCVLNGELTIKDMPDRLKANGIITSLIDITKKRDSRTPDETNKKIKSFEKENSCAFEEMLDRIIYTVWDTITIDEYYNSNSDIPYYDRITTLQTILDSQKTTMIREVEKKPVYTYEEAIDFFQYCLNRGLEGTILKASDAPWRDGKNWTQIKMKLEMDIDLEIVGFKYGTKGTKNENVIATLLCESSDGLLKTNPAGIDEKTMSYITNNQEKLLNTIITTECAGICQNNMGSYSVLHPRFKGFRDDKKEADSLEQIKSIENMIKGLK